MTSKCVEEALSGWDYIIDISPNKNNREYGWAYTSDHQQKVFFELLEKVAELAKKEGEHATS